MLDVSRRQWKSARTVEYSGLQFVTIFWEHLSQQLSMEWQALEYQDCEGCVTILLGCVLVQSRRMSLRGETSPFTESHPQWLDWFIRGVYPCTPPPWLDWFIHGAYIQSANYTQRRGATTITLCSISWLETSSSPSKPSSSTSSSSCSSHTSWYTSRPSSSSISSHLKWLSSFSSAPSQNNTSRFQALSGFVLFCLNHTVFTQLRVWQTPKPLRLRAGRLDGGAALLLPVVPSLTKGKHI